MTLQSFWQGIVKLLISTTILALGSVIHSLSAADVGGNCCADLEERIAELELIVAKRGNRTMELKISGVVNRALLFWDDGFSQRMRIVDPTVDNTSFKFEGSRGIGSGWKAGYVLKVDAFIASAEAVNQINKSKDLQEIKPDRYFVFVENEKLGRFTLGRDNSASRGIDNIELTGAETTDAEIPDWNGAFLLRTRANELLLDLPWGDFNKGKFAGIKEHFVTYTSPTYLGFEFKAAWGMNDYWDVALRYKDDWAKTFKVRAGIGYFENTTESNSRENRHDTGVGGSVAALHIPTGLNLAYNTGHMEHTTLCRERGTVSGKCRGLDTFHYVRGGIIREFIPLGNTAFYGEHYWGRTVHNVGDGDTVGALALNAVVGPTELRDSHSTVWGIGATQFVKDTGVSFYTGFRHHELDIRLVDAAGARVADKGIKDFNLIFAGMKIEF